jgi:hypothetical protein
VSDRIRESRARESLLLDEKRRMEMRHKDEEDRLSETLSKLTLELKDLQAAEDRRRSALKAAVERREMELRAAADDAQHTVHDALAATRLGLTEEEVKHVSEEARLRKVSTCPFPPPHPQCLTRPPMDWLLPCEWECECWADTFGYGL